MQFDFLVANYFTLNVFKKNERKGIKITATSWYFSYSHAKELPDGAFNGNQSLVKNEERYDNTIQLKVKKIYTKT